MAAEEERELDVARPACRAHVVREPGAEGMGASPNPPNILHYMINTLSD